LEVIPLLYRPEKAKAQRYGIVPIPALGRDRTSLIATLYKIYFLGTPRQEAERYLYESGDKDAWVRSSLARYLETHPTAACLAFASLSFSAFSFSASEMTPAKPLAPCKEGFEVVTVLGINDRFFKPRCRSVRENWYGLAFGHYNQP
jgi:hypothetical protein